MKGQKAQLGYKAIKNPNQKPTKNYFLYVMSSGKQ